MERRWDNFSVMTEIVTMEMDVTRIARSSRAIVVPEEMIPPQINAET